MRILVASDGSAAAEIALELVRSMHWPDGSVIRLVTAAPTAEMIYGTSWAATSLVADIERLESGVVAEAGSVLEHGERLLVGSGCEVERILLRGRPATVIVEDADAFGADLIVVGNRGQGGLATTLLGSVSAEVVDHAPCPVLVARVPRLTRVVLGHDGSAHARAAEDVVARWPVFSAAAIEVTSVAHLAMPWTAGLALTQFAPPAEEYAEGWQEIMRELSRRAEEAAQRLREAGLHASARVIEGDAARELVRAARDEQADLIVVGTHGRTGLVRAVLGSVARNVMLHADCSVLVVRTAGRPTE